MNREATRTLLFGLFVATGRAGLTAAQLVALAKAVGVTPTNVKSHLSRMVADGSLEGRGDVRRTVYRPTEFRRGVIAAIEQRLALARPPWDGRWLVVLPARPAERVARARQRLLLHLDGFRPLAHRGYLRPAWPAPWIDAVVARWQRHGPVVRGDVLPAADPAALRRLFGVARRDRELRALARWIDHHGKVKSPRAALAAQLAIGGRVAHLVADDPLLPPTLAPDAALTALVVAFRRAQARLAPLARRFVDAVAGPEAAP